MTNTQAQQAVFNTPSAMAIITTEAKKSIAEKFGTTVEMVEHGIRTQNENVMSMMRQFVSRGVNEIADSISIGKTVQ